MKYELSFRPGDSRRELRPRGEEMRGNRFMRYALCLSGFMRTFRQSIRQLRTSLLDKIPCDVFISTWDVLGRRHYKHSNGHEHEERVLPEMLQSIYGSMLRGFSIRQFDPGAVTPQWLMDIPGNERPLHQRIASMYYHIWEANRLKSDHSNRNGFKYDVTIRCRPDLFFSSRLWEILPTSPYQERRVFTPTIETYDVINDQFMFGSTNAMDIVADLYSHLSQKTPLIPQEPPECPLCPAERTLAHYLAHQQIEVKNVQVDYVKS